MKLQIPFHIPQRFPVGWNQSLTSTDAIPTEEQLTRAPHMDDDSYNSYVRLGINSRALVYAAMHAFSSTVIPEITSAGGGSFNKVFSIKFPDGFRVAARVPRPGRRDPGHIDSTVAMMTMARCYSGIPVPEVYAWNPDDDNAVGAPYMLLEWVEGIEPWNQWYDLSPTDRTEFLDELAAYHAKFAKPLPFQGIGSIYFAKLPAEAHISFDNASAYRLGPISRGPASRTGGGISSRRQTNPTSLRDFWLELWQHEVDSIIETFGLTRSTVIATADGPSPSIHETVTLGTFLDVAQAMLSLIRRCPLPPQSQSELFELSFATTDYAFRNIKMDPETRKITTFLDWDDVYMMPFLLCSRYPDDICWFDGSGERWHKTGAFLFLPLDEEGEIEEDSIPTTVEATAKEINSEAVNDDGSGSDGTADDSVAEGADDEEESLELEPGESYKFDPNTLPEHNPEEYDRPRRIKDTRLRRQYEQILTAHDARFGIDGFWEMRKDPLKIQHLLMNGWVEWLVKEEWVKERAVELKL
ncbi:hypothetical protein BDZ97DRAFT_1660020 [Flammula alnicola]|nr:hypothetical protein BDZ97DRAFT_1660020 [Flammula alnicola]